MVNTHHHAGGKGFPAEHDPVEQPAWLSNKWVLRSHRSNLIRKAPHVYGEKYAGTPEDMPYFWPKWSLGGWDLYVSRADHERIKTGERIVPDGIAVLDNGAVIIPEER